MRILVDADACPVRDIVERTGKAFQVPVLFVTDYNHFLQPAYGEVITVEQLRDSADLKIAGLAEKGDIVVTGDYGVAALVLAKGCGAISFSGTIYTDSNIDSLLLHRHIGMQLRKSGKHTKGPKKRTVQMDCDFEAGLRKLLEKHSI